MKEEGICQNSYIPVRFLDGYHPRVPDQFQTHNLSVALTPYFDNWRWGMK
ncbi:MAG: hypothetical protein VX901_04315 [Candidatus Poribacteria bacterium]|nr:hypothetical protein [Candidatus Poribacteria bacterium]